MSSYFMIQDQADDSPAMSNYGWMPSWLFSMLEVKECRAASNAYGKK